MVFIEIETIADMEQFMASVTPGMNYDFSMGV